jgi:hypothetical protein
MSGCLPCVLADIQIGFFLRCPSAIPPATVEKVLAVNDDETVTIHLRFPRIHCGLAEGDTGNDGEGREYLLGAVPADGAMGIDDGGRCVVGRSEDRVSEGHVRYPSSD